MRHFGCTLYLWSTSDQSGREQREALLSAPSQGCLLLPFAVVVTAVAYDGIKQLLFNTISYATVRKTVL